MLPMFHKTYHSTGRWNQRIWYYGNGKYYERNQGQWTNTHGEISSENVMPIALVITTFNRPAMWVISSGWTANLEFTLETIRNLIQPRMGYPVTWWIRHLLHSRNSSALCPCANLERLMMISSEEGKKNMPLLSTTTKKVMQTIHILFLSRLCNLM
jgi:hypothetical protein